MRRTVVVKITNGLGNQLFQYAFARSLSVRFGFRVVLDTSWYWLADRKTLMQKPLNNQLQRLPCFLRHFRIVFPATPVPLSKLAQVALPSRIHFTAKETQFYHYDAVLMDRIKGAVQPLLTLWGFWQATRYFDDVRELLRREIAPARPWKSPLVASSAPRPCVAVHIRRGDLPPAFSGICGMDYYEAAIREVRSRVKDPKFLLFTDDLGWVKDEFCARLGALLGDAHVMDNQSDVHNFYDMLACRHFIIANSTFSWWPAWLATARDTVVVAPRYWFKDRSWTAELFPDDWVRVENKTPA